MHSNIIVYRQASSAKIKAMCNIHWTRM